MKGSKVEYKVILVYEYKICISYTNPLCWKELTVRNGICDGVQIQMLRLQRGLHR